MESESRGTKRRITEEEEPNYLTLLPPDLHSIISKYYYFAIHDPPLVQVSPDNKIRIRVERSLVDGQVRYCTQALPKALMERYIKAQQIYVRKHDSVWFDFSVSKHTNYTGGYLTINTHQVQKWQLCIGWEDISERFAALIEKLNNTIRIRAEDEAIVFHQISSDWIAPHPFLSMGQTLTLE